MKTRRPVKRRLYVEELEPRVVLSTTTLSSNWSGYAVVTGSGGVNAVSGSWVVPTVSGSGTAYSSVWVGIDGFNSSTVEQIGTEQDVVNGVAQYSAWVEMYPAYPVTLNMAIHPGDTITASVTASGSGKFTLTIKDVTQGGNDSFTTTQSLPGAQRSSAEWVVEAPSSNFGVLPLANFGTVSFSNASVTLGTTTSSISNAAGQVYQINMANGFGTEDTTSALSSGGTSFSVTYDPPTAPTLTRHLWWWFQTDGVAPPPAPTEPTAPTGTTAPSPVATTAPTGASGSGSTVTPTTGASTSGSVATPTTSALVLPPLAPATTQPATAAPASAAAVSPLPTSLFIQPGGAQAGRSTSATTLDGGGGGEPAVPEAAPAANPDAMPIPNPTPVPMPAPDETPASPDGSVIIRRQACDACFTAWRWEPATAEAAAVAVLGRVEEQGATGPSAAGAAVAVVLGGAWGVTREKEEERRRREPTR